MDSTDLAFAGISAQAQLIARGEISSRELVELYLNRIERFNQKLNAFRVVFGWRRAAAAGRADRGQGRHRRGR
jgi:amidase